MRALVAGLALLVLVALVSLAVGAKPTMTGVQVPLGTRDFVVKHPDHGEKRQVVTVTQHGPMRINMR